MIPPSPSNDAGQCFTSGAAAKISQQAGLAQSQFFRVKTSAIRSRRPPSSRPSRVAAGNGSPVFTGGVTFPKIAAGFVRQLVASHTIETSTRSFNGRGELTYCCARSGPELADFVAKVSAGPPMDRCSAYTENGISCADVLRNAIPPRTVIRTRVLSVAVRRM